MGLLGEAYRIQTTCNFQRSVPFGCFTRGKTHTKIDLRDIHNFNRLKLAPVAKRNHNLALPENERGQISIFFSASLVVMISIVAFVINIGLFVKAKINLQNATDSAAYAGAAVQARQLSRIAYLNWEMRNIYKEWLFKYYVIGNLNVKDVENASASSGVMNFRLEDDVNPVPGAPFPRTSDPFNIPSVCIHISGSMTNICKRYSVPGLPEFGATNLPGAQEASRAFTDTLISTKVNDCIDRTRLNMTVANTWTYNVLGNSMDASLVGRAPAILSDKQGAWPRAVELAIRIRNLEFIMNRPAINQGVCANGSAPNGLTRCSKAITEIEQEMKLGNERLIKAFYSGFRNLGNGDDNEMKYSFTLSEIAPQPVFDPKETSASNLLVKAPYEKPWVDLKLMMINYAIFYSAMIPRADSKTSGACDISRVAIPVPGYPLGFYKNPDVLTYYAVKGEAEFVGMFNPFGKAVKLQAYAAAKPFGGRIGPMLFTQKPNQNYIVGRTDNQKLRSMPYITSYDFEGVTIRAKTYSETGSGTKFIPGLPLPTNARDAGGSFWLDSPNNPVGGFLADASGVQFGVPNLVYDYQDPFKTTGYSSLLSQINQMKATNPPGSDEAIGLFSKFQFKAFRGGNLSSAISAQTLEEEIARVRAPTTYEASNYLIPTPQDFNLNAKMDSFGFINGTRQVLNNGYVQYDAFIYAPLYKGNDQVDLMYNNGDEVLSAIFKFMQQQETGMTKYKMAMNKAAMNIYNTQLVGEQSGSRTGYQRAAQGVSDIDFTNTSLTQTPASCNSLAGQFLYFYYEGVKAGFAPANTSGCPVPLGQLLREYFNSLTKDTNYNPNFYSFKFSWAAANESDIDKGKKLMTAYMPGPYRGVMDNGEFLNPISTATDSMRRNTYSTKLIPLDSLQTGQGSRWDNQQFAIMSEGSTVSTNDTAQLNFQNAANYGSVDPDAAAIRY